MGELSDVQSEDTHDDVSEEPQPLSYASESTDESTEVDRSVNVDGSESESTRPATSQILSLSRRRLLSSS